MNFSKHVFVVAIFLTVVFAATAVCAFQKGEPAPDFTLKSITGEEVSLSDFKGRLVVLKLATTWCPTCKELSGEIGQAAKILKEHDAVFLSVFVQDSEKMIDKYIKGKDYPMTFHALLDDGQVYKAYNVYLIPRLLVIDPDQVVQFDSAGRNVMARDIISMVKEFAPLPEVGQTPAASKE